MADQPPETPEALARAVLYGDVDLEQSADLIRTRDAALIAQHTAELTARIRELEGANRGEASRANELRRMCLELERRAASLETEVDRKDAARVEAEQASKAARERCAELAAENERLLRQQDALDELQRTAERLHQERDGQCAEKERQLRKVAEAEATAGKAIASLEAQLTASAQREAAARAEAREAALREAADAINALEAGTESNESNIGHEVGLCHAEQTVRALLTSSPPPRVDAWIPVSERKPGLNQVCNVVHNGVVQFVAYVFRGTYWQACTGEFETEDVDGDTFSHWMPLPPPPTHQPAAGTEPAKGGPRVEDTSEREWVGEEESRA